MNFKQLLEDDDAVSPVIGVILMVAITVILAAVIGTFVLGLGDQIQATAPSAQFDVDYDTSGNGNVTLTHQSGQELNNETLTFSGEITQVHERNNWDDEIGAGDSITLNNSGGGIEEGNSLSLVWTAQQGGQTDTLKSWTAPSDA